MNIEKCRTCIHYDNFFNTCGLYMEETYIGEGEFDYSYWDIRDVSEDECEYEEIKE